MKIHPETLLFLDPTQDELNEITQWAENLVVRNFERVPEPAWVAEWCSVTGRKRSEVLSYALLSVVRHQNIEWVADKLEGPHWKKRPPSPPAPDFDEDELSERDRKARTMAKLLSPDAIRDLYRVVHASSPVQLDLAEGLQGYELVLRLRGGSSIEPDACWPTPYGRRVYAWLVALGKVPLEPENPTLERINAILERAGIPPACGTLIERIRHFALDWFAHFTSYIVPNEDVELVRHAAEFHNTHRRWPWEPNLKTR